MRTPSPVRGVRPPAEHWVDRPEMEAPQGVELTGTNRPSDLLTTNSVRKKVTMFASLCGSRKTAGTNGSVELLQLKLESETSEH